NLNNGSWDTPTAVANLDYGDPERLPRTATARELGDLVLRHLAEPPISGPYCRKCRSSWR
ncbi:MAG: hypothetical protein ACKO5A_07910, partial [Actinomycetota bacterium]